MERDQTKYGPTDSPRSHIVSRVIIIYVREEAARQAGPVFNSLGCEKCLKLITVGRRESEQNVPHRTCLFSSVYISSRYVTQYCLIQETLYYSMLC